MKLVWILYVKHGSGRQRVFCETFSEAWGDFKTHDWGIRKIIYPKLVKDAVWENIPEFEGW